MFHLLCVSSLWQTVNMISQDVDEMQLVSGRGFLDEAFHLKVMTVIMSCSCTVVVCNLWWRSINLVEPSHLFSSPGVVERHPGNCRNLLAMTEVPETGQILTNSPKICVEMKVSESREGLWMRRVASCGISLCSSVASKPQELVWMLTRLQGITWLTELMWLN